MSQARVKSNHKSLRALYDSLQTLIGVLVALFAAALFEAAILLHLPANPVDTDYNAPYIHSPGPHVVVTTFSPIPWSNESATRVK